VGDFKRRALTALAVGPCIILLFAFLPPRLFILFVALVLSLAVYEWTSMMRSGDAIPAMAITVISLVPLYEGWPAVYLLWLLFSPALYVLVLIVRPGDGDSLINERIGTFIVVLLLSEVFLGLPLFSFYGLKELDPYFPVMLLLIVWASDTAAYATGKGVGRHKLAPLISPKKTVEGFLGAIGGALVVTLLFGHRMGMTTLSGICVGVAIGVLGQLGDMLESIAKRVCKVKDSSSLIPGHGGILDRIDSFLIAAPFLYVYLSGFTK